MEVKSSLIWFWFLFWFCITTYSAVEKDNSKNEVISRYVITYAISNIILFLSIGFGWIK